jgi:hypothetical protein
MNMVAAGGVDKVGGGLGSSGTFPVNNKSAGPLSVGYQIPQDLANDPILHQFMNTKYGQRYLELLAPNLVGNVVSVQGATTP